MSMQTTVEQRAPSEDGYRRDNWWGGESDDADEPQGRSWGHAHQFVAGTSREAWVAHEILRKGATMLSAVTLFEDPDDPLAIHDENHASELSDPELHVPHEASSAWYDQDYGVQRHRRRYDLEYGYVSGVVIEDRPTDDFLAIVDDVVEYAALPPSRAEETLEKARELKQRGEHRDVDILERLLRDYIAN